MKGDDLPKINHGPEARENSDVFISYPVKYVDLFEKNYNLLDGWETLGSSNWRPTEEGISIGNMLNGNKVPQNPKNHGQVARSPTVFADLR